MPRQSTTAALASGDALRRRVRRITAGCVGIAALASAALTVNLALAAAEKQTSSSSSSDGSTDTGNSAATTTAPLSPSRTPTTVTAVPDVSGRPTAPAVQAPPSAASTRAPAAPTTTPVPVRPTTTAQAPSTTRLLPPQQAPAAGNGRSHSQSGGS